MKLIEFKEQTVLMAKDQPEYKTLPAFEYKDKLGCIVFCWQLTWREKLKILFTGLIWHQVLTFGELLQPQKLMTEKPVMKSHPENP